jgi:hypothetical protein
MEGESACAALKVSSSRRVRRRRRTCSCLLRRQAQLGVLGHRCERGRFHSARRRRGEHRWRRPSTPMSPRSWGGDSAIPASSCVSTDPTADMDNDGGTPVSLVTPARATASRAKRIPPAPLRPGSRRTTPRSPPTAAVADDVALELTIRAPSNATGNAFNFNFKFYSVRVSGLGCDTKGYTTSSSLSSRRRRLGAYVPSGSWEATSRSTAATITSASISGTSTSATRAHRPGLRRIARAAASPAPDANPYCPSG